MCFLNELLSSGCMVFQKVPFPFQPRVIYWPRLQFPLLEEKKKKGRDGLDLVYSFALRIKEEHI